VPAVDVRLVDVVKRFGDTNAVDHINLEVEDGEFFSLLGPSGCGKTTTLRMIGGFEQPTSGLIELQGQDVTWLPPYKRHVNTVFQSYALFPHLTIYENVAFGLRRAGTSEADIRSKVADVLKLVELAGFETRKPTQISGGQAQRVALARALVNKPAVLLLDEPLGALDLKLRKQMQVELKRIQQDVGITFIYVTHDQEEAMTMSDRIAVMNHGKYEQLADPASLYERPRTRFVAGFLGVSNLLPARTDGTADGYALMRLADDTAVRIPAPLIEGLDPVDIGVRPEKIRLRELVDPVPAGHNQLQGTISDVSYLGVSTSYIVETRGGGRVTVYEQNVERASRSELWKPGEDVRLTWSPDHTFAVQGGGPPPPDVANDAVPAGSMVPPVVPPVSRRRFLIGGAGIVGLGVVGLAAFLANSKSGGTAVASPSPTAAPSEAAIATAPPSIGPSTEPPSSAPAVITGPLKFANWPAYIDQTKKADVKTGVLPAGSSKTLVDFQKKFGVPVDYEEKIGDNPTFYQTILPALVGDLPTGWDLIVLTDWMAARIISKGWAEKIDQTHVPNCVKNLRDPLRNQPWDPGNDYHYPWQSGMTGIGYNAKALSENSIAVPTKLADLWAIPPSKLTFLTEARDTFGLGLLKLGVDLTDPSKVTDDQLQQVATDMQPLVDGGLRFTGNDYLQDFGQKKVWAAFVWSGDLASSASADDHFVFPEEGTMIWTDNMLIPKGAVNKYTAELMMDFVYDPVVAAAIADYVYYVSPVNGTDVEIKKLDPGAETNPLLFPTPDIVAKQRTFQFLSDELEKKLNALFSGLSGT
jgi:spermidine/putrescine transport system ATP-binding protein